MKKLLLFLAAAGFCLAPGAIESAFFSELPERREETNQRLILSCLHTPGKLKPQAEIPADYVLDLSYEQLKRGPKDSHFSLWIAGRRYLFRDHQLSWYDGKREHVVGGIALLQAGRAKLRVERSGNRTLISINGKQAAAEEYPAAAPAFEILITNLDVALEQFAVTADGKSLVLNPAIRPGTVFHADALNAPGKWRSSPAVRFDGNRIRVEATAAADEKDSDKALGTRDVFGRMEKAKQKVFITERGIDLSGLRGCEVEVSVKVKGDVAQPRVPWEGIRVVLNYATESARFSDCYYDLWGTFDWKVVTFKTRVPTFLKQASLTLGIVADTGFAEFEDFKITVTEPPRTPGMAPVSVEKYTGSPSPLRGFNSSANLIRGGQFRRYAEHWNGNIFKISWRLPGPDTPKEEFEAALEKQFRTWDEFIRQAEELNVRVILELYPSFWRNDKNPDGGTDYPFLRPGCAEQIRDIWVRIAERYKGNQTVYAFELWNEGKIRAQVKPGLPDYPAFMEMLARAVNQTDSDRTMIVQPEEWWGVYGFHKLRPLDAKNIVYSLHYYAPFSLTHQNLTGKEPNRFGYPGMVDGVYWDKETMRKEMQPAVEFCRAYNIQIHVTEFSCIRWAPGADRWINDAIELFEEFGWDWRFHAVTEWPGWSPEFGPNPFNTDRFVASPEKDVLMKFLGKNKKRD